ncbi:unnamed protein product [Rhodiola kirilowii]
MVVGPLLSAVHVYCVIEEMRATPVNTLNPQRTAMIVENYIKTGKIASPADLRYQEDLLFPGRLIKEAGNVKVGSPIHKALKPSKLLKLKDIFPEEKFLLSREEKWTDMILEHNATGEDALRGWLVAAYASSMERSSSQSYDTILRDAYEKVNTEFSHSCPNYKLRDGIRTDSSMGLESGSHGRPALSVADGCDFAGGWWSAGFDQGKTLKEHKSTGVRTKHLSSSKLGSLTVLSNLYTSSIVISACALSGSLSCLTMGRAPCCDKAGLKKGPWSPDEDQVLINFISLNGHGNWRALPQKAGLLRCGKSCRLRWINYLRPDIKRGNFTREEEDTIINLHQMLGNRWSAIAARLPGRTDNEIKNVWHTHLKKRLKTKTTEKTSLSDKPQHVTTSATTSRADSVSTCDHIHVPQPCSSTEDISSSNEKITTITASLGNNNEFLEIDESFWSEVLSEDSKPTAEAGAFPPLSGDFLHGGDSNEMEFWNEVFNRSEDDYVPNII